LAKAGGIANAPVFGTLDEIKAAIEKNTMRANVLNSTILPFDATQSVPGYFEIDQTRKLWLIPNKLDGSRCNSKIHTFEDIISFEVIEDGESRIKGGKSQALIGGVLFGSTGAIVGGITASRSTETICSELKIVITINDLDCPKETIYFVDKPISKNSIICKNSYEFAQQCVSLLQIMTKTTKPTSSRADEILKYKALLDQGIITQEEFDKKKSQILGL